MSEHKFPQDYTVDEWLAKQKPAFGQQIDERFVRSDHQLRTNGVAGLLVQLGREIKDLADYDGELIVTKSDFDEIINQKLATVAVMLDGTIPNTRWVVMDYEVAGLNDAGNLVEHMRPHRNICQHYWDQVNG